MNQTMFDAMQGKTVEGRFEFSNELVDILENDNNTMWQHDVSSSSQVLLLKNGLTKEMTLFGNEYSSSDPISLDEQHVDAMMDAIMQVAFKDIGTAIEGVSSVATPGKTAKTARTALWHIILVFMRNAGIKPEMIMGEMVNDINGRTVPVELEYTYPTE